MINKNTMKIAKVLRYTGAMSVLLAGFFLTLFTVARAQTFQNPLRTDSILELLEALLRILTIVGVPIVIFFIVFSGFKFAVAQGNPEELQTAKRALIYAIVGGLILLGARSITTIISNLVGEFTT